MPHPYHWPILALLALAAASPGVVPDAPRPTAPTVSSPTAVFSATPAPAIGAEERPCRPPTKEFEGACQEGLIYVEVDRFLPPSQLAPILHAHGLAFSSPYIQDHPPAAHVWLPKLAPLDYDAYKAQGLGHPALAEWEQRLADPLVARVEAGASAFTDALYVGATVTFVPSATDVEIADYLQRQGVVESRDQRSGFTNWYFVRVPVGTERQWSSVLPAAAPAIRDVQLVTIRFASPAAP